MSKHYAQMMSSADAIEYAETFLPDMLGELDPKTQEEYEKFVHRVQYACDRMIGMKPKYHKYRKGVGGFWTCTNCGQIIGEVHYKFCENCGISLTLEFPNYDGGVEE